MATELSVEEAVDELEEVDEAEKILDEDQSGSESHSTDEHDEFPDTSIMVAHVAGEKWLPLSLVHNMIQGACIMLHRACKTRKYL